MTIDELKEKVSLAEEKVTKIEKIIERHKSQGEKKIIALNKIMEQNNLGITYVKNQTGTMIIKVKTFIMTYIGQSVTSEIKSRQ